MQARPVPLTVTLLILQSLTAGCANRGDAPRGAVAETGPGEPDAAAPEPAMEELVGPSSSFTVKVRIPPSFRLAIIVWQARKRFQGLTFQGDTRQHPAILELRLPGRSGELEYFIFDTTNPQRWLNIRTVYDCRPKGNLVAELVAVPYEDRWIDMKPRYTGRGCHSPPMKPGFCCVNLPPHPDWE